MTKKEWVSIMETIPECKTAGDRIGFLLQSLQDFNWHRELDDALLLTCALLDLEKAFAAVVKHTGDLFTKDESDARCNIRDECSERP